MSFHCEIVYTVYIYILYIYIIWLVVSNMNFIFHFIYGMSSFPLILTPSFFKMVIYCTSSYSFFSGFRGVNVPTNQVISPGFF